MTERALQRKSMTWLNTVGKFVNKSPSQWDRRGIADVIGTAAINFGRFGIPVAIEFKQPGKYKNVQELWDKGCTTAQRKFLREWQEAGGLAIVADSFDIVHYCVRNRISNLPAH